ncbi:hypothetical protein [Duncaniella dubosii]|uniref:hypothetical protein n=1 Tax=Duncaniella dubosii TaxID=2518971 RepID=UPI003F66C56E
MHKTILTSNFFINLIKPSIRNEFKARPKLMRNNTIEIVDEIISEYNRFSTVAKRRFIKQKCKRE